VETEGDVRWVGVGEKSGATGREDEYQFRRRREGDREGGKMEGRESQRERAMNGLRCTILDYYSE